MRKLFRRCLRCSPGPPSCPPRCPSGHTCSLQSETCDRCAFTTCIKASDSSGPSASAANANAHGPPNVGAIAGGIVGGVIFVGIATWLFWRFCIKARRQREEEEQSRQRQAEPEGDWVIDDTVRSEKSRHASAVPGRHDRASTHTAASAASSVFTRASNVIQIAYIPGVTNRSPPSTPGLLVPPVPPLPSQNGPASPSVNPHHPGQDRHFFMPDIRDSTYSNVTDHTINRESVAPSMGRSSVATTIYRNHAVVNPIPAQTVIRGKAAVVSVKSSNQSSPDEGPTPTPPMPTVDYERYGRAELDPGTTTDGAVAHPDVDDLLVPPSPAFSVGSTFLSGAANTAKAVTARPISVRKPCPKLNMFAPTMTRGTTSSTSAVTPLSPSVSGASKHSRARRPDLAGLQPGDRSPGVAEDDDEDVPGARARQSLLGPRSRDSARTVIEDSPMTGYRSPFSDTQVIAPAINTTTSSSSPHSPMATDSFLRPLGSPLSDRTMIDDTASVRSSSSSPTMMTTTTTTAHHPSGSLSAVIEEAARRAARQPTHGGLGSHNRDQSPFSDANAVRTP